MDKSSYDTTSDSDKPVHVSAIASPTSAASSIDISMPQDRALPQNHMVAVGRSDGSVFIVKLGDSYLTQFMPVPRLVVEEGEEEDDVSVRVDQKWMDSFIMHMKSHRAIMVTMGYMVITAINIMLIVI